MVRPRKEQVRSRRTHYSAMPLVVVEGTASQNISSTSLYTYTISDTWDGAEKDVGATLRGSIAEPFSIIFGDVLILTIDGIIHTITFATGDTTISKVTNKINTVVGATVAFNDEGYLFIRSATVGSSSTISYSGSAAAKVGFTSTSLIKNGINGPARGILGRSSDQFNQGGIVPIKTKDGKNVVTDCSGVRIIHELSTDGQYQPLIPGGIPIYGRLQSPVDGTNFTIKWYAKLPEYAEVITSDSDFGLLDGTNTFSIFASYIDTDGNDQALLVSSSFSGGPGYTRDQVIGIINNNYATAASVSGKAYIESNTANQPYAVSGEQIYIEHSGGSATITFAPTDITADLVRNKINASLAGVATSFTSGNKKLLQLSDPSGGFNGYLIIKNVSNKVNTLGKLGFSPGTYYPPKLAEPYGDSEIKIRSFIRGSAGFLTISSDPTTLGRLGLTSGTFYGDNDAETPVNFPSLEEITNSNDIDILIPEVLEFGDVPADTHSKTREYAIKSAGSNYTPQYRYDLSNRQFMVPNDGTFNKSELLKDIGKPVVLNGFGFIDRKYLREAIDESYLYFKQFIRGEFDPDDPQVDALVAGIIETTGTNGNPLSLGVNLYIDIDPTAASPSSGFRIRFNRDAVSKRIFEVFKDNTFPTERDYVIDIGDVSAPTVIRNQYQDLRLEDNYTNIAGTTTGGIHYVALAGINDTYLKVMEQEANPGGSQAISDINLIKQINGRWVTTIGDGTNSRGDFNGADAIKDAIDYYVANINDDNLLLQVKAGTYNTTASIDFSQTSGSDVSLCVTIEGIENGINIISGITHLFEFGGTTSSYSARKLVLRNLKISSTTGGDLLYSYGSSLEASKVEFVGVKFTANEGRVTLFDNCEITAYTADGIYESFMRSLGGSGNNTEAIVFRNSKIYGSNEYPIIKIRNDASLTSAPMSEVELIEFDNCEIRLGGTSITASSLDANSGILEVDPNSVNGISNLGTRISNIRIIDCNVSIYTGGYSPSGSLGMIFIFHIPSGRTGSPGSHYLPIDNMLIKGGRWILPDANNAINPLTIFGIGDAASTQISNKPGLVIDSVTMGWEPSTSTSRDSVGDVVTQQYPWFGATPNIYQGIWGAFAIGSNNNIKIKDWTLISLLDSQECGDIFIYWRYKLLIDGIHLQYQDGAATANYPIQRIRLRSPQAGTAEINKIIVDGGGYARATSAIIFLEPYSTGDVAANVSSVNFRNCEICNTVDGTGIYLPSVNATDTLYSDSGGDGIGSQQDFENLTVENCVFKNLSGGYGIQFLTIYSDQILRNCVFNGNRMIYCEDGGIYIEAYQFPHLQIINNYINRCGLTPVRAGIYLQDNLDAAASNEFIVSNNIVFDNKNIGAPSTQIQLYLVRSGALKLPKGIMIGNMCQGLSLSGYIQINRRDGTGASVALDAAGGSPIAGGTYTLGTHTGVDNNTVNNPLYYQWVTGGTMNLNQANLASP